MESGGQSPFFGLTLPSEQSSMVELSSKVLESVSRPLPE